MSNYTAQNAKIHFFASHSWNHSHHRERLHQVLQPWRRGIDFEDYSISRAHPLNTDTDPALGRELRDIIRQVDALIIMAGFYANNKPWMLFEIDMAFAFDKPIIPILAYGQEKVPRLPTRLASCPPIRWRGASIREALLSCVSPERRQAIELRQAYRETWEAQQHLGASTCQPRPYMAPRYSNDLAKRLPLTNETPNHFSDPPTSGATFLSDLLRRR